MSWLCVILLVFTSPRSTNVHPSRARARAGLPHTDLFAKRALFDGASPTLLVIRSKVPDEWVSTAVVVPDALIPEMGSRVVAAPMHWAADGEVRV